MKSPQLANGYTPIANELLEHLIAYKFSQNDYKVLLAIIRKTYGYHKKMDAIGNSQLAVMTGLQRTHVARSIRSLIAQNVLICDNSHYKNSIGLNKHYQLWGKTNTAEMPLQTNPQTMTKLVTEAHQKYDQIGLDTVTDLVTLEGKNYDQIGHTQKIVKDSINKTLPPPEFGSHYGTAKNDFSGGGLQTTFVISETPPKFTTALIFPKALSPIEQTAARNLLANCPDAAQGLLDVLSATIKAGKIQTSALALLGALVRRQLAGTFDPSPGFKIKLDRERVPKPVIKVVKTSSVDKETQRQNMANLLAGTKIRLSNREA